MKYYDVWDFLQNNSLVRGTNEIRQAMHRWQLAGYTEVHFTVLILCLLKIFLYKYLKSWKCNLTNMINMLSFKNTMHYFKFEVINKQTNV